MFFGIIYRWLSPSGRSYVGQTVHPAARYSDFFDLSSPYGGIKIERARRRYNLSSWQYFILESALAPSFFELHAKLDAREIYYISKYDSFYNGYNGSLGGRGVFGKRARTYACFLYTCSGDFLGSFNSASEASLHLFSSFNICVRSRRLYETAVCVRRSAQGYFLLFDRSQLPERLSWLRHKRNPSMIGIAVYDISTGSVLGFYNSVASVCQKFGVSSSTVKKEADLHHISVGAHKRGFSFVRISDVGLIPDLVVLARNWYFCGSFKVYVFDLDFKFLGLYPSLDACCRELRISRCLVRSAYHGRRACVRKLIFSPFPDIGWVRHRFESVSLCVRRQLDSGVDVYDMSSGSFIKHCVSVLAASEFTGVDRGRVAKCCFGESSFCGNFKFSFSYASTGN